MKNLTYGDLFVIVACLFVCAFIAVLWHSPMVQHALHYKPKKQPALPNLKVPFKVDHIANGRVYGSYSLEDLNTYWHPDTTKQQHP